MVGELVDGLVSLEMSTTTDSRRIDIDLREDLGADDDLSPEAPGIATLEVASGEGSKQTVMLEHGHDEWTFVFDGGECVEREPATRALPGWVGEALGLVENEIR